MSTNQALAERFELIGRLIDVLGEDPKGFRAAANLKAARIVADYPGSLRDIALGDSAKTRLQEIDGVGPKIADKIIEFFSTGQIAELDELRMQVPGGLLALLNVPGLGPKTVRSLWKDGGVTDLAGLKAIIASGKILALPRMGEKSVQKISESIALAEQGQARLHIGVAVPIAEAIVAKMKQVKGVSEAAFAGSARRGKETVGDLDILVACDDGERVANAFCAMPEVTRVLVQGESRSSVRVRIGDDTGRYKLEGRQGEADDPPSIQVDLRVVPRESWGAALMYFTGSKEHNVRLRERAQALGLTLNEYGLFPEDDKANQKEPPQKRGVKSIAGTSEEAVYNALGLRWIPPEMREDRGEIALFESKPLESKPPGERTGKSGKPARDPHNKREPSPFEAAARDALLDLSDIVAELHAHTTASDGIMSIVELATMAKARGFHTIAVTDHSKSSVIANGLSPERLRAHIKAVHAARAEVKGISILAGSEVDILSDGSLDYDDDLLSELDVVVASPHAALSQDPAIATGRLLKAIRHPMVHIIGHPTGRLINRRAGLSPDMGQLIAAAVEHNVALEINAHWMRLDLRDTHVRQAVEAGALIAIDCDVHEPRDYDNLRFGVATARRGWLSKHQCINAWSKGTLEKWLKSKR